MSYKDTDLPKEGITFVYSTKNGQIKKYISVDVVFENILSFLDQLIYMHSNPSPTSLKLYSDVIDDMELRFKSKNASFSYNATYFTSLKDLFPISVINRNTHDKYCLYKSLGDLFITGIANIRAVICGPSYDISRLRYELHLEQKPDEDGKPISNLIIDCFNIEED